MKQQNTSMLHPDENLLTAFAEQALTPGERGQVLAHLADCGRCREVVFLAQSSLPDVESPQLVPVSRRRSWRMAFAGASAFALIAMACTTLLVHRHGRKAELASPTTQALAVSPPAAGITAPTQAPREAAPRSLNPDLSSERRPPSPARSAARSQKQSAQVPAQDQRAQEHRLQALQVRGQQLTESPPTPRPLPVMPTGQAPSPLEPGTARSVTREVQPAIALHKTQAPASQRFARVPNREANEGLLLGASARASAGSAPNSLGVSSSAMQTASVSVDQEVVTGQPAHPVVFAVRDGLIERSYGGKPALLFLPNRSRAVAVASLPRALLGLDASGLLFRSADGGTHWAAVAQQWAGKAVTLSALPASTPHIESGTNRLELDQAGNAGPGAKPADVNAALLPGPSPSPHEERKNMAQPLRTVDGQFELMNNEGKSWVSLDGGVTWQPR